MKGFAWLDTGTIESLFLKAGQFIETIEKRQDLKIGCLEEISFKKGFITREQLIKQAKALKGTLSIISPYSQSKLVSVLKGKYLM